MRHVYIQEQFPEYCEGCPHLNLDANVQNPYGNGMLVQHIVTVRCCNEDLCRRIYYFLKGEKYGE